MGGLFVAVSLLLQTACAVSEPVTFAAMGDMPYAEAQYAQMSGQIADFEPEVAFLVHLGDIKPGKLPCDEPIYARVATVLHQSKVPVFIVPGDNEYNDCADPLTAWRFWTTHFMRFDERWPSPNLNVQRQALRSENFAFVSRGVLFVGVHVVGGRVHDQAEWDQRHKECVAWLQKQIASHGSKVRAMVILGHAAPAKKHTAFFDGVTSIAKAWTKPILYIHGDGHKWKKDHPFKADNILRVQVDAGGKAPPVRVTVTEDPEQPFIFDRRKTKPTN